MACINKNDANTLNKNIKNVQSNNGKITGFSEIINKKKKKKNQNNLIL